MHQKSPFEMQNPKIFPTSSAPRFAPPNQGSAPVFLCITITIICGHIYFNIYYAYQTNYYNVLQLLTTNRRLS